MKASKSLVHCLFASGITLSVIHIAAATLPVIDLSNLSQTILEYQQQQMNYSELLSQTGLEAEQLTQLYADYEQMLTHYDQVLLEAQGLRNKVSNKDWGRISAENRDA